MNKHLRTVFLAAMLAGSISQVFAGEVSTDAVLGGALGGGAGAAVGSAVGGRSGALIGGALGAATGVAIATPRETTRVRTVAYDDDDGDGHHDHGRHLGHYKHHHERD